MTRFDKVVRKWGWINTYHQRFRNNGPQQLSPRALISNATSFFTRNRVRIFIFIFIIIITKPQVKQATKKNYGGNSPSDL